MIAPNRSVGQSFPKEILEKCAAFSIALDIGQDVVCIFQSEL